MGLDSVSRLIGIASFARYAPSYSDVLSNVTAISYIASLSLRGDT